MFLYLIRKQRIPTCLRIINYFGGIAVYRNSRPRNSGGHSHCMTSGKLRKFSCIWLDCRMIISRSELPSFTNTSTMAPGSCCWNLSSSYTVANHSLLPTFACRALILWMSFRLTNFPVADEMCCWTSLALTCKWFCTAHHVIHTTTESVTESYIAIF